MTGYNATITIEGRKRTIGLSTNFKLEQFYEIGDLTIYENTRFTAYRFHQDGKITAIFVGAEGGLNTPVDREAFKKWAKERQYSKWVRKLIRITWADGSKSRVFVFGFEDNHLKGYAVDALLGYTAHHNHFATSKIASIEEIL